MYEGMFWTVDYQPAAYFFHLCLFKINEGFTLRTEKGDKNIN